MWVCCCVAAAEVGFVVKGIYTVIKQASYVPYECNKCVAWWLLLFLGGFGYVICLLIISFNAVTAAAAVAVATAVLEQIEWNKPVTVDDSNCSTVYTRIHT